MHNQVSVFRQREGEREKIRFVRPHAGRSFIVFQIDFSVLKSCSDRPLLCHWNYDTLLRSLFSKKSEDLGIERMTSTNCKWSDWRTSIYLNRCFSFESSHVLFNQSINSRAHTHTPAEECLLCIDRAFARMALFCFSYRCHLDAHLIRMWKENE